MPTPTPRNPHSETGRRFDANINALARASTSTSSTLHIKEAESARVSACAGGARAHGQSLLIVLPRGVLTARRQSRKAACPRRAPSCSRAAAERSKCTSAPPPAARRALGRNSSAAALQEAPPCASELHRREWVARRKQPDAPHSCTQRGRTIRGRRRC